MISLIPEDHQRQVHLADLQIVVARWHRNVFSPDPNHAYSNIIVPRASGRGAIDFIPGGLFRNLKHCAHVGMHSYHARFREVGAAWQEVHDYGTHSVLTTGLLRDTKADGENTLFYRGTDRQLGAPQHTISTRLLMRSEETGNPVRVLRIRGHTH